MGLLPDYFNSEDGRMTMGLLAAGGPTTDPNRTGFGQRMLQAVGSVDEWKQQQRLIAQQKQQQEYQQMQMAQMKAQSENQARMHGLAEKFATPAIPMSADGFGPSTPASFDRQGYAAALEGLDPTAGLQYAASIAKDNTPISVAPGASLVDKHTFKPLFTAPKEFNTPAEQQGYELAQSQGYAKSYVEYQKELKKAGATNVSLSNVGPKAFETELGKMDAEQLGKWREGAMAAQSTLGSVQRLENADAKGAYAGGAANLKMTVGSYINGLTGSTPKGQIGSELYTAEANNLVLSQIKTLGANPSNADLIFIQKTVPQLSTNADARKALTQFMREKAQSSIGLYQRANTHARKNSGLGGFDVVEPTSDIEALLNKYK